VLPVQQRVPILSGNLSDDRSGLHNSGRDIGALSAFDAMVWGLLEFGA
jgi:hypothetical protein